LPHEELYLSHLPSADLYERSLMHRDVVNLVAVTRTDFFVTTSVDGHVKFWKKTDRGIEFVKHFRAHLGPVVAMAASDDGALLATAGADKAIKVFDVVNFDMINIIKLSYLPNALCWCFKKGDPKAILACSDLESPSIFLFDGRDSIVDQAADDDETDEMAYIKKPMPTMRKVDTPLSEIQKLHSSPVHIMQYNPAAETVVSVDAGGMIEYWRPEIDLGFPAPKQPSVSWEFKSETDLYEFKKCKTVPTTLTFSPDYSKFVTFGFDDRQIRIFNFRTGRVIRKYDESLSVVSEMQQAGTAIFTLDDMEFGRRLALERDIERVKGGQAATVNAVFDESGHFVIYPTLLGIKIVNIETNRVVRLIGKMENQRFMNIALYQGAPRRKNVLTLAMAASDNTLIKESEETDPTIIATAFKKNRFYLFSNRDPDSETSGSAAAATSRDVFNEKPSREEQTVAAMSSTALKAQLGSQALIHTSVGDIHLRLFPEHAPKAVENFVGLAKKAYYDGVLFHRVISGFMLQTGDPLGDGTGGESLWGADFEDEFVKALKHDRPYTVSMANCGPNTNASQFFITTVPTPWLDNKHTIFGRVTAGMDVVHRIEKVRTDKQERPLEPIKIMSIEVR
ncbi:hypothetical protein HK405_003717, partial [Cladochytrium tenue]